MSRCSSCGPNRGCCDFSSKAERLPSLAAIDVVEGLLTQALRNTARRRAQMKNGELTQDDLNEADDKVVAWFAATFSGANPHYRSEEAWNPEGLADYLREMLQGPITEKRGSMPTYDKDVIAAAAEIFLIDIYGLIDSVPVWAESVETSQAGRRLVNLWAQLLTGAPAESAFG